MTPLIAMVGADKGGVGKTTVSRLLVDYFASKGRSCRIFDTEHPKGGLTRFVPRAVVVDLETIIGQMQVFDDLSGVTIIDVRAGTLSRTLAVLRRTHFLDDVKSGAVNLALLHVLGPSVQSLGEIPDAAAAIGGGSKHYLVKNYVSKTTRYFEWDSPDGAFANVLSRLEPQTVVVSHLEDQACELIDKLGASFASFSADGSQSRMLRGYVRSWVEDVWQDFDKIGLDKLSEGVTGD